MLNRIACVSAVALVLIGCQTTKSVWLRADGRVPTAAEFELDRTICEGAVAQTNIQGGPQYCRGIAGCAVAGIGRGLELNTVRQGCMASRGYVLRQVPVQTGTTQVAEVTADDPAPSLSSVEQPVQHAALPASAPVPQAKPATKQVAASKQKRSASNTGGPYVPAPSVEAAPPAEPEPTLSEADRTMNMRN